jgi:hypothetical protein
VLIGLSIILFLAQSRGAIISLFFVMLFILFPRGQFIKSLFNIKRIFLIGIIAILFSFLYFYIDNLAKDDLLIKYAFERIFKSDDTSKGGFRFEIWTSIVTQLIPLPIGIGYNLVVGVVSIGSPHSDFLRLIYSYWVISVLAVSVFLFGKFKKIEPLIIPAIIAFSINTLIDEQKVFALFLSFLAIFSTRNIKGKIEQN